MRGMKFRMTIKWVKQALWEQVMREAIEELKQTLTSWPGVKANPHRFGGTEFNLGKVEIGHMHSSGMVDIPFNSKIRTQLLAEKRVEPHHLLPDTGWITFYIRSDADVEQAIWLFRLSYLFYASRSSSRVLVGDAFDIQAAVDALHLSDEMRTVFTEVSGLRDKL